MEMTSDSSFKKINGNKTIEELYLLKNEYEQKVKEYELIKNQSSPFGEDANMVKYKMYQKYYSIILELINDKSNNENLEKEQANNNLYESYSSVYQYIKSKIVNGQLPRNFKINDSKNEKVKYVDGAMDGIVLLHATKTSLSEIQYKLMVDIVDSINAQSNDAIDKLVMFSKKIPAINCHEELNDYIFSNRAKYDPSVLSDFVYDQLQKSNNNEVIKYCLCMLELLMANKDERVKEIVRTLALCNEFTFYTLPIISSWENSNEELFKLVKNVYGWGRIFTIEQFRQPSKEIENWLITEGLENDILPIYSATTIFQILNIEEKIENCSIQELEQYIKIIKLMLEDKDFSRFLLLKRYPNTAYKLKTKIQNLNLESKYPELMNLLNEFINECLNDTNSNK